jgi:hypothetical protein
MLFAASASRPAAALRRLFALLAAFASLAGCASGDDPGSRALHAPVPEGMARLVIFYPGKVIGSDGRLQITFDAFKSCHLDSGGYLVRDLSPGDKTIAISFCGMPGVSYLKLYAVEGEKYYIRVVPYDSSFTGILSGYPSEAVPEAPPASHKGSSGKSSAPSVEPAPAPEGQPPHKGPFLIEREEEAAALKALSSLQFSPESGH